MYRNFYFKQNVFLQILRNSSGTTKQTTTAYCLELVRKHDYENYLCTLLLSSKITAAAFVIRAFNVEIAQVKDQVRDYKIGEMRLKFWTDALNNTYKGNPPKSPVMLELHKILQKHSLSKHYFKRLIDIRFNTLRDYAFNDINAIENYAEYSNSSIYYLLLQAHGITDINADHAASHMGKAHGIVNLIRSIPYNIRKRTNMLPQDILMKYNISTEAILQGQSSKDFQNVIFDIASCGKLHLDAAISFKRNVTKEANLIFLPIVCIQRYLNELMKADFDIFNAKLQKRDNLLPLYLYWKSFRY
ncbi:NADH dehydrogenase (ubiquinone) complex I, assembly factor 6 [Eufriesea mexicana]|uniref:NADH dehydrogenase (ubiquinone) complex I, assembly factor 6 n=1 Tax=Eufriesea mexicana TaxID=516756 RepID=UPI00083C1686|nr:PREDICTED: NADH dehydrogenase (ubiquinone) complex I, assembly factor 6 [Eufriesea mexicana]OAD56659.1 NADH dehydrogenase (ubiquinone) complex I, assembly factor 6 [Eufriesea mexicana]